MEIRRETVLADNSWCFRLSLVLITLAVSAGSLRADILLSGRRITWAPGVRGGAPHRSLLLDVTKAPYYADPSGKRDSSTAIQAAINAATPGHVVYLPTGIYAISSTLTVLNNGNITIRGDGPDRSVINYIGSSGINIIVVQHWSSVHPVVSIQSGYTQGSNHIVVSDASSLRAGSFVLIRQNNPSTVTVNGDRGSCGWCGDNGPGATMTQVDMVTGVSGNRVTLERPMYLTFSTALNPTVQRWEMITGVGIENLQVLRSNSESTNGANIELNTAAGSWIQNVKSLMAGGSHIELYDCYACQVKHSEMLDGWCHGSGCSYGVWMFGWNSEHLIEDNIIHRCRHSLVYEGGGSGNVCGYNYCFDGFDDTGDWLSGDMDTHGSCPYMNLSEGNIFSKLAHDNTWGSSSYNTTFRCWATNYSSGTAVPTFGRWAVDIQKNSYYESVVGCVIGRSVDSGSDGVQYVESDRNPLGTYRLGYEGPGNNATPSDRNVGATASLHCNFDYISNTIVYDASNSDRSIERYKSLYYPSKPAMFGDLNWPPFDPTNPGKAAVTNIPAGYRYVNGTDPPGSVRAVVRTDRRVGH